MDGGHVVADGKEGLLFFKNKKVILANPEIKVKILKEAHQTHTQHILEVRRCSRFKIVLLVGRHEERCC